MDQKGHIADQKGLKMYEKGHKILDLKYLLFVFKEVEKQHELKL